MFASPYASTGEAATGRGHLDDADQLAHLAQQLPAHIRDTALPQVADEMASATRELHAQVDGTRQLLLQSAALRRSTVLAPLLKQRLVAHAVQLQRRRAALVQHLQRQVRHWRTTQATASDKALQETWSMVQASFRVEESAAHLVRAPLCPPAAALRAFLREATAEPRQLHRRVAQQLAGTTQRHSPAASDVGGSGRAADTPAAGAAAGSATPEDAIEAALHLLLRHSKLTAKPSSTAADRRHGTGGAAQTPASTHGTARAAPSPQPPLPSDGAAACDADVYSDDVEAEEASLAAEEDVTALRSSPLPPPSHPSLTNTASLTGGEAATAWLRVPGIVSLDQYCAELPWVAELSVKRYAEARERKKRSSSGAGEVGYMSRHVQPGEAAADGGKAEAGRPVRFDGCGMEASPAALQMLAPLGYLFAPALALEGGGAGAATSAAAAAGSSATTESAVARALRHASGVGASAAAASPTTSGESRAGPASAQEEERAFVARVVVRGVTAAVDATWQRVEEEVVMPFCAEQQQQQLRGHPTAAGEQRERDESADAEEQEAVSELMEVLRVRYAVELAAQVLAARHATELVLDSEDAVIFEETRLVSLLVGAEGSHGGGGGVASTPPAASATTADQRHSGRQAQRPAVPSASVLTFTVLSLPGVEEIFYVLAYCTGASLLREVAATAASATAATATRFSGSSGGGASSWGRPGHVERLVIDVDGEAEGEEDDDEDGVVVMSSRDPHHGSHDDVELRRPAASLPTSGVPAPVGVQWANEEDPAARQQAAVQVWAMTFEKAHLQPRFLTSAVQGPRPLASYFRLWLYLWEYVLVVSTPESTAKQQPSRGKQRSSGPAQLCIAARTARRWVEKAISAALQRGGLDAGLILHSSDHPGCRSGRGALSTASSQDIVARLQSYLTPEQAAQVVKGTALQARQALLHVSSSEGQHGATRTLGNA